MTEKPKSSKTSSMGIYNSGCGKRLAEDAVNTSKDYHGYFRPFKLRCRKQLRPVDPDIWQMPATVTQGDSKPVIQATALQEHQQQLSAEHAHMMLEHEDCSPPVPDSMLMAPSHIMDTDAPTADQDPPTGYPSPATSGHSSAAYAAHHESDWKACQDGANGHHSLFCGGCNLSLVADEVPPNAVLGAGPSSLPIALSFCQQYQQLQFWQLQQQHHQYQQQQQAQPQDFNSPMCDGNIHDESCTSGQSHSQYQCSAALSQDPPTGYPTPCAGCNDTDASMPRHDWTLLQSHSDARLEKDHRGRSFGNRLASRFDDAPRAIADLDAASRRLQHECSCHNTPQPSQDSPTEHSEAGDDECSFAGGSGACSVEHPVTAPPSPVHSEEASPGLEDEDEINGSYADDVVGDPPPSPVPSQDAPSEYPEPMTPASSAKESEVECSAELSDLSRELLPPGVETSDTLATATFSGKFCSGMSRASFHHAVGRPPLMANSFTGSPYNSQRSWWENLEEQGSLDCVWDDCESGDQSVVAHAEREPLKGLQENCGFTSFGVLGLPSY